MDTLLNLPMKLASVFITLALIFMAMRGPPPGSAPQRASAQLEFPFMVERKLTGHRALDPALDRKVRRLVAYARAGVL